MLDAYIIDAIRRQEIEQERAFERSRLYIELEIPRERAPDYRRRPENEEPSMGDPVVIPLINPPEIEDDAA